MVTDYFVGNKNNFAIEFRIRTERYSNDLFGWLRFWLGGKYVGAYDNLCILSVTLHALEQFIKKDIETEDFNGLSKQDIYQFIKFEDIPGLGKYWFTPGGDSFDDFSIIVYSHHEMYNFIWKLYEDPFFEYKDYPKGFQFAKVSIDDFKEVVKDFGKQLNQLGRLG